MNNFTFYSPTLFTFGDGEEKNTGALVRRFGGSRVLLVTGGGSVRRNGAYDAVTASLEEDVWFPTKEYSDFALPQGSYTALRVVIGEGAGQNWWCVVFPPLCLGSVSEATEETAALGGLSQEEVALMTGETEGYVVKFKAIELWEGLKAQLGL